MYLYNISKNNILFYTIKSKKLINKKQDKKYNNYNLNHVDYNHFIFDFFNIFFSFIKKKYY